MKISRAVITAAGSQQRHIPLQTVVDREGDTKTVLRVLLEDVFDAGVDEAAIVVRPGDSDLYADAAGDLAPRLTFVEQKDPRGYGDAVLTAREFVGEAPFLLLVSDHLFVSDHAEGKSCVRQLVEFAAKAGCASSAVQPTHESKLPYFGAIGGQPFQGQEGVYDVERVIEKPTPTVAEQELLIPGLRPAYYLCFFGMHVLPPEIFGILDGLAGELEGEETLHLSPALSQLASAERYLAHELAGRRYDLETRFGGLLAQLAVALDGNSREELLTGMVDLLAQGGRR